ncbi:PIP5K4 [Symbiodinium sp. CCMP2592]|nr:PIP5K4 [Symbiodinium sp. CCMP2592]
MALGCCRRKRFGFEGGVEQGLRHGHGVLRLQSGTVYMGQWEYGVRSGRGEWSHPTIGRYVGDWKDNQMHGDGLLEAANGARYTGQWSEGRFHEEGYLQLADGTTFEGSWRKGRQHGAGKLHLPDGKTFEGQWVKGEVEGKGTLSYGDDRKKYKGQFRAAKPHGFGSIVYADGLSYEGQWQYGKPAGKGKWCTKESEGRELTPVSSVRPSPRELQGVLGTGPSWEESTDASSFRGVQELQAEEDQGAEEVAVKAECSGARAEQSKPSKFELLDAELSAEAEASSSSLPRQPQARPGLPKSPEEPGLRSDAVQLGISQQVLDPFARRRGKSQKPGCSASDPTVLECRAKKIMSSNGPEVLWEVSRPSCPIRAEPHFNAEVLRWKRQGDRVSCIEMTMDGWLKIADDRGWMISDMQGLHGIGEVLSPKRGEDVKLAVEEPHSQGVCCLEIVYAQVAVRASPSRDAVALYYRRKGELVFARSQNFGGWLRLAGEEGWMLAHAPEHGTLLRVREVTANADLWSLSDLWAAVRRKRRMLSPTDVRSLKDAEEGTLLMADMDYEHHVKTGNAECLVEDGLLLKEDLKKPDDWIRQRLFAYSLLRMAKEEPPLNELCPGDFKLTPRPPPMDLFKKITLEEVQGEPKHSNFSNDREEKYSSAKFGNGSSGGYGFGHGGHSNGRGAANSGPGSFKQHDFFLGGHRDKGPPNRGRGGRGSARPTAGEPSSYRAWCKPGHLVLDFQTPRANQCPCSACPA